MRPEISEEINKLQLSLIYDSRVYTTVLMTLCAIFVYFLMAKYDFVRLSYWLAYMVIIDAYRIFTAIAYARSQQRGMINIVSARNHLVIGMVLSGLGWGLCTVILYPQIDLFHKFILFGVVIGVATASTTTLSYKKYIALLYIALMLVPFIATILYEGEEAIILSLMVATYAMFLVKNISVFYRNSRRLLVLEIEAEEREREVEIQRQKAIQANATKSDFLANISHELRTPMHAILGFSELGMKKQESATHEEKVQYYPKIQENGKRLLSLLNDLLDLSKLEAGKMVVEKAKNDVVSSIDNMISEVESLVVERGLYIDRDINCTDTVACYDGSKILQVLLNLMSNAIKFSPQGGRISVTVRDDELTMDDAVLQAISVSVADQGAGIPDGEQEQIFDKFVQSSRIAKTEGTGLGLSICHEIINLHSGVISASNNSDGGATFSFSIPRDSFPDVGNASEIDLA